MAKVCMGVLWGVLFGTFFLSGLAFLAGRQIYYDNRIHEVDFQLYKTIFTTHWTTLSLT